MALILKNLAKSTLSIGIDNVVTSVTVSAGTGSAFPVLGASDYFYAALQNAAGTIELVKVTARSGDTMTITRGQEGTTAVAWAAGDVFAQRLTVNTFTDYIQQQLQTARSITGVAGTNTLAGTISGFTGYTAQAQYSFIAANINTGPTTMNISAVADRPIFYNGVVLVGGEIVAGGVYLLIDNGTQFTLVNPKTAAATQTLTYAQNFAAPVTLASAATLNIGAAASNVINVTGTSTINAFDTIAAGAIRYLKFISTPTISYNGASLILPGAASISAAANDEAVFESLGAGNWKCISYTRADGTAIVLSIVTNKIQSVSSSVAGNALTLNYNGGTLDFRNASLTSGIPVTLTVAANSITVPSGATLNVANGVLQRYALLEAYNGGAPVACIACLFGGIQLDETNLISPTTISGTSNNNGVIYSASAVSVNSPYRVVGFFDITCATSGLWASDATLKQGIGGEALTALSSVGYGQTLQLFTVGTNRISGTTYINTTGKPIMLYINVAVTSGSYSFSVDGTVVSTSNAAAGSFQINWLIPTGVTYAMTFVTVGTTRWFELR